jgi:hypothetical protein
MFLIFCLGALVSLSRQHCVDFFCLDDLRSNMGVCVSCMPPACVVALLFPVRRHARNKATTTHT